MLMSCFLGYHVNIYKGHHAKKGDLSILRLMRLFKFVLTTVLIYIIVVLPLFTVLGLIDFYTERYEIHLSRNKLNPMNRI